jgi:DNA-binding NarL/FixJ family response regulator
MSIRVLLADDHKILRAGVRLILEQEDDMEVVADVADGRLAVQAACELAPDVVVMDVTMPELNGIDATRRLKEQAPGVRVLILSVHLDKRYILEALKAGANGFIPKDSTSQELISAIRAVAARGTYLSPKVASVVVGAFVGADSEGQDFTISVSQLTPREREVLQHISEGKSTKDIAYQLKLSGKTVDTYRIQLMRKLDLHSVADLTKFAVREGITPP